MHFLFYSQHLFLQYNSFTLSLNFSISFISLDIFSLNGIIKSLISVGLLNLVTQYLYFNVSVSEYAIMACIIVIACIIISMGKPSVEETKIINTISAIAVPTFLIVTLVHAISSSLVNSFRRKNGGIAAYSAGVCKANMKDLGNRINTASEAIEGHRSKINLLTSTENKTITNAHKTIELMKKAITDIEAIKDDRENIALHDFYLSCKEYECETPTVNEAFVPVWDKAVEAVRLIDNS